MKQANSSVLVCLLMLEKTSLRNLKLLKFSLLPLLSPPLLLPPTPPSPKKMKEYHILEESVICEISEFQRIINIMTFKKNMKTNC